MSFAASLTNARAAALAPPSPDPDADGPGMDFPDWADIPMKGGGTDG